MRIRTNVKAGYIGQSSLNHNETLAISKGLKVRTHVRAGGSYMPNNNETLVRDGARARGLKVRTHVRAGGLSAQHNEALVREASSKGVKVRTHLRAGGQPPSNMNHNETLVRKA